MPLTLTGYIGSNHPKTQMYNPDNGSYTPNWQSSNLVLTPSLYVVEQQPIRLLVQVLNQLSGIRYYQQTAITTGVIMLYQVQRVIF